MKWGDDLFLLELFKTPVIFAAIITGSIAALNLIIQWFIASTKNKFDTKNMFEKNLKEKLENIYSPLIMQISLSSNKTNLIEGDIKALINKYGYLLTSDLLSSIKDLCKLEESLNDDIKNSVEYQNIRVKIEILANREFKELQNLFNNNFNTYKLNLLKPWYKKIALILIKIFALFTSIFWLILILFIFLSKIQPIEISQNPIGNRIVSYLLLIVLLTTILGFTKIMDKSIAKIIELEKTRKKRFKPYDYVPQTGKYRCIICNEVKDFYKDEQFPRCNSSLFKNNVKSIVFDYIWSHDSSS